MDEETAIFIVIMTAMVLSGWLLNNFIKIWRDSRATSSTGQEASREVRLLSDENAELKAYVGGLEERIAVLERIATDPAHRTAREIEELR